MTQQPPRCRPPAPCLQLTALACTFALAVALPVAATAGPAPSSRLVGSPPQVSASPSPSSPSSPVASVSPSAAGAASSCGPEVASGEGLSAQTCVLSGGGRTWARTYYRNATGAALRAALTLTRPDGSSLRAECRMFASGGTGVCSTPGEKSRTGGAGYAATAEAGTADGERLLLRSGSNSHTRYAS